MIEIKETFEMSKESIISLYQANQWSSAQKPEQLYRALMNSHSLVSAWDGEKLVGLANAISDGHLVVYYPHLLVLPEYQRSGIGKQLMDVMSKKYSGFHQQMLTSDVNSVDFYKACGFERAGKTVPMWIYDGDEH
ncbi:GNAT superfamily N-acetyltransferase [Methanohalophilus levihalophilus]|uniref:GNAT family N-acetyltransferase n=1 Tax=Methanohalophilus levihalophilus TaxID=1431282 RepID=UPI001AE86968|nr:GNAT family N-acetyltransferase [Methanohalophilus levihalophilus]MBP2031208.1 GNAT superfamily N-acetyltransferase [Methanohalophilus levihalophilus]